MSLSTTQYGYIVDPMVPFTDDKGKTIKNGFIRVFMAGTSTPVLTYRNYDGATNQEKIELDNSGRVKHNVIGSKGSLYKVVVYDAHHSQETPIITVDKIAVLGASINATGATIVTGLDSVTVPEENFLKATVEGTSVELALDPTEVTSEVSTISSAETEAPDVVVPLLDKTGEGDSKKISLANLFKFALDWISRLATTITSFASGDFIAVSNPTDGTRKMSKDTLLQLTAEQPLARVDELKSNTFPYIDFSNPTPRYIDSSGNWTSKSTHNYVVQPINGETIFLLKANASTYSFYTFLRTYDKEDATSDNPTPADFATGYTGEVAVDANTLVKVDIPSDANFVYIRVDSNNPTLKEPQYAYVSSVDNILLRLQAVEDKGTLFFNDIVNRFSGLVRFYGGQRPTFTKNIDGSYTIGLDSSVNSVRGYYSTDGKLTGLSVSGTYEGNYTLAKGNYFVFNVTNNIFVEMTLSALRSSTDTLIILLYNSNGYLQGQWTWYLVDTLGSSVAKNLGYINDFSGLVCFYGAQRPTFVKNSDNSFTITVGSTVRGYYATAERIEFMALSGPYEASYSLAKGNYFVFNVTNNIFVEMTLSALRSSTDTLIILLYNSNGYLQGQWVHYLIEAEVSEAISSSNAHNDFIGNNSLTTVCHRGNCGIPDVPENSIHSITAAYMQGQKFVEVDIKETADGEYVCMHDSTINRTMVNADGTAIVGDVSVSSLTLAELKSGYVYNTNVSKYKTSVTTFDEWLQRVKELKLVPMLHNVLPAVMEHVVEVMGENFIYMSSTSYSLQVRALAPSCCVLLQYADQEDSTTHEIADEDVPAVIATMKGIGGLVGYSSMYSATFSDTFVRALAENGMVWMYSTSSPQDTAKHIARGVNFILTNNWSNDKLSYKRVFKMADDLSNIPSLHEEDGCFKMLNGESVAIPITHNTNVKATLVMQGDVNVSLGSFIVPMVSATFKAMQFGMNTEPSSSNLVITANADTLIRDIIVMSD